MNHIIIPRMSYGLDLNLVSFWKQTLFPFLPEYDNNASDAKKNRSKTGLNWFLNSRGYDSHFILPQNVEIPAKRGHGIWHPV